MPAEYRTHDITYLSTLNVRELLHLRFKLGIKRETATAASNSEVSCTEGRPAVIRFRRNPD